MPNKYQATPLWETSGFKKLFGSSSTAKQSKPFYTEENFPMMTSISNGVRSYGSKLQDALLQSGVNTGKTGFHSGQQSYTAGTAPDVSSAVQAPLVKRSAIQPNNDSNAVAAQKQRTTTQNQPIGSNKNVASGASGNQPKRTAFDTTTGTNVATTTDQPLGDMGWGTKQDIINYQKANGLVPDGIVGPKTIAALKANPPSIYDAANASINQQAESRMHQTGNGDWGYGVPDYNSSSSIPSDANTFFNGSWTNPRGYTNEQMKNLTREDMIALKDAKSPLESAFGMAGNAGQFLGGLGGLYAQYQNAKFEKDKMNIAKQQQRAIDANTSAFARAAGGTYTPTGV